MRLCAAIIVLSVAAQAQSFIDSNAALLPDGPRQHRFWTVEKKMDAGILAGLVAADGFTTQRGLSHGLREENPLMRPFVTRGPAGQVAGFSLGFGAGLGVVYLLHRTHHYRTERVAMRLMVAGESGFVANNIVEIH